MFEEANKYRVVPTFTISVFSKSSMIQPRFESTCVYFSPTSDLISPSPHLVLLLFLKITIFFLFGYLYKAKKSDSLRKAKPKSIVGSWQRFVMATDSKSTMVRVKSSAQDVSSKPKIDSLALKKKVISSSRHPSDSKMKSVTTVTKSEVKSKPVTTSSASSKTITKTTTTKVRERKVYSLPGQKHDPPEQKEPLRIFYELMEHGLLSPERAKKAFEKKQRKQKELRTGTPVKSSKPQTKTGTSQKQPQASKNGDIKAKKRIISESDDDDDFILSHKRRKW
ncbi:hypothetical protein CR513_60647, partial [Mucuna pruriens]